MNKPDTNEYAHFYSAYINKVDANNIQSELRSTGNAFSAFLSSIPSELENYKYAEGKWTIKQVVQHIIDAERVFAVRALRISRNDQTNNPGFEENDYANEATAEHRSLNDLKEEFGYVRNSNVLFFDALSNEDFVKTGIANDSKISVRALAFIIVGHQLHHQQTLQERYL